MTRRAAPGLAVAILCLAPVAWAQPSTTPAPIIATPLPPPDPAVTPAAPPVRGGPGGGPGGAPGSGPAGRAAAFPDVWQPRQGATIQALDKINARHAVLTLRPGVPVTFQTLTIMLKACVVRPPDQPADAAAFVSVADRAGADQAFNGWLIRSIPSVSMLQHPMFDLRVMGCLS
jgi:hypothetical protein